MKFSVVIPVHNEENYLPYTLKPLLNAPVYEFIFVLDRCTDRSEDIVLKFASHFQKCKILYKTQAKWLNSAAEAYDFGAQQAIGDYIYLIDADVVIDQEIFNEKHWKKGDALRFRYYNYNINGTKVRYAYEKILLRLSEKLRLSTGRFATVIAFKRKNWEKTRQEWPPEDIEGLRKRPRFVIRNILLQEYAKSFVNINITSCLHLRPKVSVSQQQLRGIARYLLNYPLWKVVLHSLLYFEIYTLISFLQAKHGLYGDIRKWVRPM